MLIYMAILITPLRRARRVDQFAYLIYPNQSPDEKVMRFESFLISEPTHTSLTGLAYKSNRSKQI
jgi:hypothetical protein